MIGRGRPRKDFILDIFLVAKDRSMLDVIVSVLDKTSTDEFVH